MANKIELTGIDDLLNQLRRKLQNASSRVENKALQAAGEPIAEAMREKVNRSDYQYSYHIKDNIRVSRVQRRDGVKYVLIGPTKKVGWRGHFLEFGTSKMSARPFAEPSFHEKKGEALQTLADEMRKGLRT
ncbi:HK97 gp10 family phage protein [Brevibacillus agri]|uniref:HK97-gp10 family putative phage morphogenesis protein n=1 Tax=Brevibacillus agri TaxID=51101 RepID=UPI002E1E0408|nr:HK97 gp10 family phage protein [Brevibacillus agri]MED1652599.1 HK97 gp10 family phage protein [Brevibacillus agri]MED1689647.1 HK97 gp10 family phage protein [Brevibacillus agri]MED1691115.1 HK97 gp10 family phage protein [Brevibacillus agri]MED1696775.1 HK97 gp10 family phage protein [Brevibacillus agri]